MIFVCFSFALSYGLVLSILGKYKPRKIVQVVLSTELILISFLIFDRVNYSLIPILIINTAIIKKQYAKIYISLAYVLSALLIQLVFILFLASIIVFIEPNLHLTMTYNYIISAGLIIYGGLLKLLCRKYPEYNFLPNRAFIVCLCVLELLIVLFSAYIAPLPTYDGLDTRIWFAYHTIFCFMSCTILLMAYYILFINSQKKAMKEKEIYLELSRKLITEKYNQIILIKHYYSKLYQSVFRMISDKQFNEVENFLEEYIKPVHMDRLRDEFADHLKLIKNPLLYNLVYDTVITVRQVHARTINLYINKQIYIDRH